LNVIPTFDTYIKQVSNTRIVDLTLFWNDFESKNTLAAATSATTALLLRIFFGD
jgi:hypothetical protein